MPQSDSVTETTTEPALPAAQLPALTEWAALAVEVSQAIRRIGPTEIIRKGDDSPVTAADQAAHELIDAFLVNQTPDIPVISEEGELPANGEWQQWRRYWCVDPLDGTQSFIDGHQDYSINIGLIEDGRAVFGVLGLPGLDELYIGGEAANGVWQGSCNGEGDFSQIEHQSPAENPIVAVSRSSNGSPMQGVLAAITSSTGQSPEVIPAGGASKFAMLATQTVDIYPRFGRSMIWDTAAGDALLSHFDIHLGLLEGGQLSGERLTYGGRHHQHSMANPHFIAALPQWLTMLKGRTYH